MELVEFVSRSRNRHISSNSGHATLLMLVCIPKRIFVTVALLDRVSALLRVDYLSHAIAAAA